MEEIKNIEVYNRRMRAAMEDKLWWLDKVDVKVVVDYGCADGALLQIVHEKRPDLILIGVDNNPNMLELALKNVPKAIFYNTEDFADLACHFGNAVLVLSSVIHEIYAYDAAPYETIEALFEKGFRYIAIRDMFLRKPAESKLADPGNVERIRKKAEKKQLAEFERKNGSIGNLRNMIHYLLKYRYVENWDREVKENYFPCNLEDFLGFYVCGGYQIEHLDHYVLPFLYRQIKQDFDIELEEPTHLKLLLKNC